MAMTAEALTETVGLAGVGRRLATGIVALERAADAVLAADNAVALTVATPFLKLAGDVIGGWILGRQAMAAAGSDDPWLVAKASLARLYASQVLSLAPGLADAIAETDPADLEATPAGALAG
jgi:hypothetical protein